MTVKRPPTPSQTSLVPSLDFFTASTKNCWSRSNLPTCMCFVYMITDHFALCQIHISCTTKSSTSLRSFFALLAPTMISPSLPGTFSRPPPSFCHPSYPAVPALALRTQWQVQRNHYRRPRRKWDEGLGQVDREKKKMITSSEVSFRNTRAKSR